MKKLLSIVLSILIVIPSVFIASAETINLVETQEFCDAVNNYIIDSGAGSIFFEQHITDNGDGTSDITYSDLITPENVRTKITNIYKETETLVVFWLSGYMPMSAEEKIGDYIFNANNTFSSENPCGYCIYTDGKIYGIADAVSQNIVTAEELAKVLPSIKITNLVETQEFCDAVNNYIIDSGAGSIFFEQHITDNGDGTSDITYSDLITLENVRTKITNIYKETETFVVFWLSGYMPMSAEEKIGDYIFNANNTFSSENPCGYCVYTVGKVYGIAEAVSQNIVTVEELAEVIPNTEYLPNDKIELLQSFINNGFNVSYAQIIGVVDDCELYRAGYEAVPDAIGNVIIGNYLFVTRGLYGDDNTGLYIKKNNIIYTLSDSYKQGVVTDEQMDVVNNILTQNNVFDIIPYKFNLDAEKALQSHYQISDTFSLLKICEIDDCNIYSNICENEVGNYSNVELGDYKFTLYANQTPYNLGIYVISNEEVYTLEEAYNSKLITDLSAIKDAMYEQSLINFNFSMEKKKDPVVIIPPVDEPKISVTTEIGKIKAGERVNPFEIVNPKGEAVTYTAKTPDIATVSDKGVVTGLQKGNADFVMTVGDKEFNCRVKITSNPKLMKNNKKVTAVKLSKKETVKLQLVGKVKNIKNVYKNTQKAKITSGKNATTINVKGLKKGTTTLKIKVNGVKTLKLKVTVK